MLTNIFRWTIPFACWALIGCWWGSATVEAKQAGQKLPADLLDLLDVDGDGQISDAEALNAVKLFQKEAMKRTPEGREALKVLDTNGDGKVDADEAGLAVARARIASGGASAAVSDVFKSLDQNEDERITPNEFQELIQKLGPLGAILAPSLGQFFNQMDANRDGAITLVESQLAAEYFAQKAALKKEQQAAARNQQLWQRAEQTLLRFDRNRDKRLVISEVPMEMKAIFPEIDLDINSKLTLAELYDYLLRKEQKD